MLVSLQLPHGHILFEYPNQMSLAQFDPVTNKWAGIAKLSFVPAVSFNINHTDIAVTNPIIYTSGFNKPGI